MLQIVPRLGKKIFVLVALVLAGFDPSAQEAPTFRSTARLVPIYATVRAADGRLLTSLNRQDFEVLDNGQPRAITQFSSHPVPIVGVALWDVSPSMAPSIDRLRAAARSFVDALWPDDRIRFGSFSEEVAFSPLLTFDKAILRRIIDEELWPGRSGSPVWTALREGMSHLRRESGRRVLVVLSDGEAVEQASTKDDVERQLQEIDCMVYAIGLEGRRFSLALRNIAEFSGGGFSTLGAGVSLDDQFRTVVAELHHQYLIGFVPEAQDGLSHAVTLHVKVAGANVRARRAYIAPSRRP